MTEVPLDHRHRHPAWINQEAQVWRKSWMRGRRDIFSFGIGLPSASVDGDARSTAGCHTRL